MTTRHGHGDDGSSPESSPVGSRGHAARTATRCRGEHDRRRLALGLRAIEDLAQLVDHRVPVVVAVDEHRVGGPDVTERIEAQVSVHREAFPVLGPEHLGVELRRRIDAVELAAMLAQQLSRSLVCAPVSAPISIATRGSSASSTGLVIEAQKRCISCASEERRDGPPRAATGPRRPVRDRHRGDRGPHPREDCRKGPPSCRANRRSS